jgi:hypothetical protein
MRSDAVKSEVLDVDGDDAIGIGIIHRRLITLDRDRRSASIHHAL